MFSYYGSKSKIVQYYPRPTTNQIIEPFAGSARYALRYFEQDVWLNDSYQVIADIWTWIINASQSDIDQLPELTIGDDLRDFKQLSEVERQLLGFAVQRGVATPGNKCNKRCAGLDKRNTRRQTECRYLKQRLTKYQGKIRHWKVTSLDYRELPNQDATWYIDPPYQFGGEHYKRNKVDYPALAEWCKSRNGQPIVCENSKADWLPFKQLVRIQGSLNTNTVECIWTR
jgi:site-specific DNA-adenine methylase